MPPSIHTDRSHRICATTLLVVVLVGIAMGGVSAADPEVTLMVDAPAAAEPGETVTLSVTANATEALYSVEFALSYDTDIVEITDVSAGEFLEADAETIVAAAGADQDAGRVSYAESRTLVNDGVTGEGEVASITVAIDENATGALNFAFVEGAAVDPDVNELTIETRDATIELPGDTDSSQAVGEDDDTTPNGDDVETTPDGDSESSNGPSSDGSTGATDTVESVEDSPVIDPEVRSQFDDAEWVGVIVHVTGDSDSVPDTLRTIGAQEIQPLDDKAIAAFVNESMADDVAVRDNVHRISRDETAETLTVQELTLVDTTLPSTVSSGTAASVTLVLANPGDIELRDEVTVAVNGTVVAERDVHVGPGTEHEFSIAVPFDQEGNATVMLDGSQIDTTQLGTVSVNAAQSTPEARDTVETDDETAGFGVTVTLVAVMSLTGTLVFARLSKLVRS